MSGPARAVAAVIRYEAAATKVASATKAISEALGQCPVHTEMESGWGKFGFNEAKFTDGKYVRTHLHEAMKETVSCDAGYGDRRATDDEIEEILEEDGCEPCLRAWRLVRQRKNDRQEFGIAKRVIRAIGRAAIAKATGATA